MKTNATFLLRSDRWLVLKLIRTIMIPVFDTGKQVMLNVVTVTEKNCRILQVPRK